MLRYHEGDLIFIIVGTIARAPPHRRHRRYDSPSVAASLSAFLGQCPRTTSIGKMSLTKRTTKRGRKLEAKLLDSKIPIFPEVSVCGDKAILPCEFLPTLAMDSLPPSYLYAVYKYYHHFDNQVRNNETGGGGGKCRSCEILGVFF